MSDSPTAAQDRSRPLLSPSERASEIVFGVIMTLSVTAALNVGGGLEDDPHSLLAAALGCNIAWGMVDAVMYLVNTLVGRTRERKLATDLRAAGPDDEFRALLGESSIEGLAERLDADALARLRAWMRRNHPVVPRGIGRDDLLAALQIWALVFVSTFPLVIPFLVFDSATTALRVTQATAIAILFGLGVALGRWIGARPWVAGAAFAGLGAVITAACIALGG